MTSLYDSFGFGDLANWLHSQQLHTWADTLPDQIERGLSHQRFGDLKDWLNALDSMPEISADQMSFGRAFTVSMESLSETDQIKLDNALKALIPWRKGPYSLCGIEIDAEWRSDMKWDRLKGHIGSLQHKRILDVGCGNGYHMWRMLENKPEIVIGIDPSPRFSVQFEMVKRIAGKHLPLYLVPAPLEDIPSSLNVFDSVFSMGVIYHRKSPLEHIKQLKDCLIPGGELVLESIVVDGDSETCLKPKNRYAKMRNVWVLPSSQMMIKWLEIEGFDNIQLIDESVTTVSEQRRTPWMRFESLADFLDPRDSSKTIEGYPAPKRAVILARKKR